MQGKLASIITALILTVSPAESFAAKKPIKKQAKTFDLKLNDTHISETSEPSDAIKFNFDEPSAGEKNLVDQMKLRPEFNYVRENDDLSPGNDLYDRQIKLKLNLDF